MINIKFNEDVLGAVDNAKIIMIVGKQRSGKTTLANFIRDRMKIKNAFYIPQQHNKADDVLYKKHKIKQVSVFTLNEINKIAPIDAKWTPKSKPNKLLIFDDCEQMSAYKRGVLGTISTSLDKRRCKMIVIYHHASKVGNTILNDGFLIVKQGNYFTSRKLSHYFDVPPRGLTGGAEILCRNLKGYEALYIFKDCTYTINGNGRKDIPIRTGGRKAAYSIQSEDDVDKIYDGTRSEVAEKLGIGVYVVDKCRRDAKRKYPKYSQIVASKAKSKVRSLDAYREGFNKIICKRDNVLTIGKTTNENLLKWKESEDTGDLATKIVGDVVGEILDDKFNYYRLFVDTGLGSGLDIIIETFHTKIGIEVKNWDEIIYKSHIENKVIPRFKDAKDYNEKWLFYCGKLLTDDARYLLEKNNIKYISLARKQITSKSRQKKWALKIKLTKWLDNIST